MTKVFTVQAQIKAPSKACRYGQVCFGHYTIDDGILTMTDDAGEPAVDSDGKRYTRRLVEGDNPEAIAVQFTRDLRTALRGGSIQGFDGPIDYSHQPRGWR